jgi:hypothetical protein
MAWQKIGPSLTSDTWKYKEENEIEGKLIGWDENVGPNDSNMYQIQKSDGTVVGVWGTTLLDIQLKSVEIGVNVKIVYKGMNKSPKSGREYHDFDVYREEDEIPVIEENEAEAKEREGL